jgi:DNA-directed RNA polymerase specialized sigma24 family protein
MRIKNESVTRRSAEGVVPPPASPGCAFAATRWSVVLAAREDDSPAAQAAMAALCQAYWYPLYAYVRRKGTAPHDAQDLTQAFFARLLEKKYLRDVHPERGRFRSFLLACLNHFLAKEWRRGQAQKRGGGRPHFSLDQELAEGRYRTEPSDVASPDKLYDRRWALTVLENTMRQLGEECTAGGKGLLFESVRDILAGGRSEDGYAVLGAKLGMSVDAVKQAIRRLRVRYGELLRGEVAQTLMNPADVDEEIRSLFFALA